MLKRLVVPSLEPCDECKQELFKLRLENLELQKENTKLKKEIKRLAVFEKKKKNKLNDSAKSGKKSKEYSEKY